MGSGGMIVLDEDDCMVDIAKFYLRFCVDESCGKCSPCRIGGFQMLHYLKEISRGKASQDDLVKLENICNAVQKSSLCGLGQTAPNPILSTLKYFRNEYDQHINDQHCGAKKCTDLLRFVIAQQKCVRCGMCSRDCPVNAIPKNENKEYIINQAQCIKCGKCFDVCKFDAVIRE